ncbi:MAG: chorismate synthase [Limnochordales bacterium]
MRFLTAGESHGPAITAILEGMPAGVPLTAEDINQQLQRRQLGYGRGRRMQIESDQAEILTGVRHGRTLGSPIALLIRNKDWAKWQAAMAVAPLPGEMEDDDWRLRPVTRPRPGHADLPGLLKYDFADARNVLERASARETAMRVAVGAVARRLLAEFGIVIASHVIRLGPAAAPHDPDAPPPPPEAFAGVDASPVRCLDEGASQAMVREVDEAKAQGETLGGVFEVIAWGVPPGLGSHVHWDRKLDGRIAQALMSIQAIKGVEFGLGFETGARPGSQAHDPILYSDQRGIHRPSNRAGGVEGGMTNGEPLVVRVAMKPLATLYNPLPSIDITTLAAAQGAIERSDVTAVPAAAVVGEAAVALELARAMIEKFGGDSLAEMQRNFEAYAAALARRGMRGWRRPPGSGALR